MDGWEVAMATASRTCARAQARGVARRRRAVGTGQAAVVEDDRWSPRVTMLFLLGVCGAFWALVTMTAYAVIG